MRWGTAWIYFYTRLTQPDQGYDYHGAKLTVSSGGWDGAFVMPWLDGALLFGRQILRQRKSDRAERSGMQKVSTSHSVTGLSAALAGELKHRSGAPKSGGKVGGRDELS